jgi:hypothetical protein
MEKVHNTRFTLIVSGLRWLGYAVLVIFIGMWVNFWVRKTINQTSSHPVSSTPLAAPPKPTSSHRQLSIIATQSAFTSLEGSLATFSDTLNALPLTPQELNPPVIELDLGLENK